MGNGMSVAILGGCQNPILTPEQIVATLECARVAQHSRTIRVLSRILDEMPQFPEATYTLLSLKPKARVWLREIVLNGLDAALSQVQDAARQNEARRADA